MNSILLEKSESNSPETKRSKSNRTPDDIKRELDKVLKDGFNTFYGGNFLLIPYLLHLGIVEKINALNVDKQNGIPIEKAVLALLHMGILGKKRICRVGTIEKSSDFLIYHPSYPTFSSYLQIVNYHNVIPHQLPVPDPHYSYPKLHQDIKNSHYTSKKAIATANHLSSITPT
uniref:Uncharacterized protein n=1 Tax=Candidatus Methanophaga sp. ANME-1 ERB7 TaxID=2759913 RepID=A0A7G9Z8G3_9EURY|nr:hypothetical protein IDNIJKHG_00005 [Methanosarcinales archaeon ANME-1 ERB7]